MSTFLLLITHNSLVVLLCKLYPNILSLLYIDAHTAKEATELEEIVLHTPNYRSKLMQVINEALEKIKEIDDGVRAVSSTLPSIFDTFSYLIFFSPL